MILIGIKNIEYYLTTVILTDLFRLKMLATTRARMSRIFVMFSICAAALCTDTPQSNAGRVVTMARVTSYTHKRYDIHCQ
ncbi:MAG: hypothetical protein PHT25_00570 [Bacteroidales bacterium]|nr:hypothetical protein [Bacteroidales bacterium]